MNKKYLFVSALALSVSCSDVSFCMRGGAALEGMSPDYYKAKAEIARLNEESVQTTAKLQKLYAEFSAMGKGKRKDLPPLPVSPNNPGVSKKKDKKASSPRSQKSSRKLKHENHREALSLAVDSASNGDVVVPYSPEFNDSNSFDSKSRSSVDNAFPSISSSAASSEQPSPRKIERKLPPIDLPRTPHHKNRKS